MENPENQKNPEKSKERKVEGRENWKEKKFQIA